MLVSFDELRTVLFRVLEKNGFAKNKASLCAEIFAGNSRDGVDSHGLNRFPVFIDYVKRGLVDPKGEPETVTTRGCTEQWDGHNGAGVYLATLAMNRAIELARLNGMGCVSVRNTNHWMRGGTYGWQAAEKGCIAICGTNAIANMPPWGGTQPRLANNPLVIAVPRKEGHVVLDMAMSQFSYGKMNEYKMKGSQLPVEGGYDQKGKLTKDPAEIIESQRPVPVGFWKGSGLSLMMDLMVSCLSDGRSVKAITDGGSEAGVSQFFLAIDATHINESLVDEVISFAKSSMPVDQGSSIRYPGEQTLAHRRSSEKNGVEVNDEIWEKVKSM